MRAFTMLLATALLLGAPGFSRSRSSSSRSSSSSRTDSGSASKSERVSGYTRKNGTPVAPYNRRPAGTAQHSTTPPSARSVPHRTVPRTTSPRQTSPAVRSSAIRSRKSLGGTTPVAPSSVARPAANSLSATRNSNARCATCARDSSGRIARSETAKHDFQKAHPCPATGKASGPCPGYVIDHVVPLKRGGADMPSNI
jgi:hypothetical protein